MMYYVVRVKLWLHPVLVKVYMRLSFDLMVNSSRSFNISSRNSSSNSGSDSSSSSSSS